MFSKILVANRGEVAVRIIRTCREMGISTVAVFSQADREALHVSLADEAICIGGPLAKDSYLNKEAILSAAIYSGATAIHPGYGFLSESASFSKLCEQCRITFIGPAAATISHMGDKDAARRAMAEAGVPVIPGVDATGDAASAKEQAIAIGFPVLIKARSGGGGKGIRLVESADAFESAFNAASSEAAAAFGDGAVYVEKYLTRAKHIEVQLLCDSFGTVIALGERECSIQRNNQKMIEESPASALDPSTREAMIHAATTAARKVGYEGVGTVEFLLGEEGTFYFIEMNTRLQVEHPVTEMVTGIDIVKWQIRVAAEIPLPFSQEDITVDGAAIECRINAEDPLHGFRPSAGTVSLLHIPGGPQVRFDSAIYQGYSIPVYYDSMMGKVIVYGKHRDEAIRKMKAALSELVIEGVDHNSDLLAGILSSEEFELGTYCTDFMDNHDIETLC